jgi:hypothetical protein
MARAAFRLAVGRAGVAWQANQHHFVVAPVLGGAEQSGAAMSEHSRLIESRPTFHEIGGARRCTAAVDRHE